MHRFIALFLSLILCAGAFAEDRAITVVPVYPNTACLVNSTNYSATLDLGGLHLENFDMALQVVVTNATTNLCGKVALSYDLSNNGNAWVTNKVITAEISYTNSPVAGGTGWYTFDTGVARYMRFKALTTETNAFLSGWLAVQ